jgi:hypothetical protein
LTIFDQFTSGGGRAIEITIPTPMLMEISFHIGAPPL